MLEEQLKRIADALERQNEMTAQLIGNKGPTTAPVVPAPPAAPVTPKKETKAPKNAPVIAPAAAEEPDPFSDGEDAITVESLMAHLTEHAKLFGNKVTIDLIKKHGADPVTPKIKTIPQANWKACWDEASADIKKVKK